MEVGYKSEISEKALKSLVYGNPYSCILIESNSKKKIEWTVNLRRTEKVIGVEIYLKTGINYKKFPRK